MKRFILAGSAVFACLILIGSYPGHGQRPLIKNRVPGVRPRALEEGITRQAEILRLENMIEGLETRIRRLERQQSAHDALPSITIEEADAALLVAEKQFEATQKRLADGTATELDLARDRLDLSRARNQQILVKAAFADRGLALEADVTYASRLYVEQQRQQTQLQRLVARGFSSGEGLEIKTLDVNLAKRQLERAQARLKLHQQLTGTVAPPEAGSDDEPSSLPGDQSSSDQSSSDPPAK